MKPHKLLVASIISLAAAKAQTAEPLRATGQESLLHALARVGQESGTAIGIIQLSNGALCQPVAGFIPNHSSDISATFDQIAKQADYEVVRLPTIVIFRPHQVSGDIAKALNFRFPAYPKLTGTMSFLGQVLQGSLQAFFDKNLGILVDSLNSPEARNLTLAQSTSASVDQIASQIVNLGPRGLWILSDDQSLQKAPLKVVIATYSYEDDTRTLDRLPCYVPPKVPVEEKPEALPKG